MSEPENIEAVLQQTLTEFDPSLQKKILQQKIFKLWNEIFKSLADKISPIKIQGETLIVKTDDSAIRDMMKYNAENFIKLINEKISPTIPVISEIKFARSFKTPQPLKVIPAKIETVEEDNKKISPTIPVISEIKFAGSFETPQPLKVIPAKVETVEEEFELTPEEIKNCENQVVNVTDKTLSQTILDTFISFALSRKRKLQHGWHKCKLCNLLCPPNEKICNICKVTEREKMVAEIRKIFVAAPETPFREIQQKIIRQFPHIQNECTLEKIEAARMDLILQRAAKISYGDTTSDAVIFLVRLIRQLPREKLTEPIINRTLKEFKFNLADLPRLPNYEFSKLNTKIKKIVK